MTRYQLTGKVALVTGAAKGIGLETARLLHQRGARVAVLDLDRAEAEATADGMGDGALALDADVTDLRAMELAIAEVVERCGGLDVVVANAGIAPPPRPVAALGHEDFERVVDVDLYGVWRTVRPAVGHVIERRGHIVVVASVYAFLNGVMATPYAMSKAAVEALGRSLRVELAPHGASAGVAYFGFIDTDMVRDAFADPVARELEEVLPRFVTRRLTPAEAAASLVGGIERRAPRTTAPRWWGAWSALRGVVNPALDRLTASNSRIAEAIQEAERESAR